MRLWKLLVRGAKFIRTVTEVYIERWRWLAAFSLHRVILQRKPWLLSKQVAQKPILRSGISADRFWLFQRSIQTKMSPHGKNYFLDSSIKCNSYVNLSFRTKRGIPENLLELLPSRILGSFGIRDSSLRLVELQTRLRSHRRWAVGHDKILRVQSPIDAHPMTRISI